MEGNSKGYGSYKKMKRNMQEYDTIKTGNFLQDKQRNNYKKENIQIYCHL